MEYIFFALSGFNILPSVFLIFVILYWVLIILGIFSFEVIDLDLDLDFDFDIDIDFDSSMYFDGGVELEENKSQISKWKLYFYRVLRFLNIGAVPIMIYSSILVLIWWILSMLVYYINVSPDSMMGGLICLQNFLIAVFLAKGITEPLKGFFSSMEDRRDVKIIGKIAILKSSIKTNKIAQAEIYDKNYPITINVKSLGEPIIKGSRVIVVAKDEKKNLYVVKEKIDKNQTN